MGNLIGKVRESRAIDASQFGIVNDLFPSGTAAGVSVTEDKALASVAVYAAAGIIADSIASMPVHRYRRSGDTREKLATPYWLDPVDGQPNQDTDVYTWKHRQLQSLLLPGNSYLLVTERDRLGYPSAVYNLNPADVTPYRENGRIVYRWTNEGRTRTLTRYTRLNPDGQVLQTKAFDRGDLTGLSPIGNAAEAIGLGLAAEEYGARFFGQGAIPPGIISTEGRASEEQLKTIKRYWRRNTGGTRNSHLPAVMAQAKWVPITIDPKSAQFLETRKFQTAEIARLFRVPPHLIGDVDRSTSWGSGIEEQNRMFYQTTLMPWINRLEQTWNQLLPRNQFVKFDPAGLLRADIESRYTAYSQARQWGFMSQNEIRALEDMEPVEGGDTYLTPLNMTEGQNDES